MNFKYFAFGISLLFALVLVVFSATMIGHQFLAKDRLEALIQPLFFTGFVVIGYFIAQKALIKPYLNASVLSLVMLAFIALFLDIFKYMPQQLWQLLLAIFILLQIGIVIQRISSKWLKKS